LARPVSRHPTELDLEILKVLWARSPATARDVQAALAPDRPLAYTSVLTILNIMARKRYVKRTKSGPSYAYAPVVSESATTRSMLRDLVRRVFRGSASSLVLNLLSDADLDDAELRQIRQILKDKSTHREQ
jgi:BlaI family penicillinase repressor